MVPTNAEAKVTVKMLGQKGAMSTTLIMDKMKQDYVIKQAVASITRENITIIGIVGFGVVRG